MQIIRGNKEARARAEGFALGMRVGFWRGVLYLLLVDAALGVVAVTILLFVG